MKRPCETRYTFTPREEGNTEEICVKLFLRSSQDQSVARTPTTPVAPQSIASEIFSTASSSNASSPTRQLSGVWAQRAHLFQPPLEGRDVVEYPPPNLSQTSDYSVEQLPVDRYPPLDGPSPPVHMTRSPSGGRSKQSLSSSNNSSCNSPVVAKRSLSDNLNQAASSSHQQHPLPPPQRHAGGYYSQSSSTSSQGSYRGSGVGGGGAGGSGGRGQQQLQGAWATPGKSGATVVKSGSPSRNLSSGTSRDHFPAIGSSGSSASPMFSLSRYSSASSLSSGSITPASSGTRTPVSGQPGTPFALISSSASKLEKMKREAATSGGGGGGGGSPGYYQSSGRTQGDGGQRCRGGGYALKHSVSGPAIPDVQQQQLRGRRRGQSQQFQEKDFRDVQRTPRRNVSSQDFRRMVLPDKPSRPLSDSFQESTTDSNNHIGDFQRSYSESQSPRGRRTRGRGGRGSGGRGRGHARNS